MGDTRSTYAPLLSVRSLTKQFGDITVLDGVSLSVQAGESLVVLGPSGAGKSVLLRCIVSLLRPDAGSVYFRGNRIDDLPERRLTAVRRDIGFLFQLGGLFDSMSVCENIAFPMQAHERRSDEACRMQAERVLDLVGLRDLIDAQPDQLSGGQRRRVALARAIVVEPSMMLYDEPTAGLDPVRSDVVARVINRLRTNLGLTSIIVTHDIELARKTADRILFLDDGHVHLSGDRDTVLCTSDIKVKRFLEGSSAPEALEQV
jgi:phospholipid/cholesterol/gamma-HCH transport system ATP-binding protein